MEKLKLTGLWKNTDKNGGTYLSGSINAGASVMIMPNTFKKPGDKSPDYYLYLVPREKDEAQRPQASGSDL